MIGVPSWFSQKNCSQAVRLRYKIAELLLAEHFVTLPPDPEFQQRLDALGGLANEGALSEEERREYDTYIEAMDVIALLRVKVPSRAK